ncbi:ATP-binding cassette domain-containing protein [Neisseria sp. Ec49-e6-T10]|uniref:ATP-binding cassette domain-containing protein n=1 Tax=Neisseria sp. Ec49-e6-T10 TaxID=3140744 RepID=UPI003EBF673C
MSSNNIIEAKNLTRYFDNKKAKSRVIALDNLSFSFPSGCITALAGPDGAGKTTLMRMVCGLIAPNNGSLTVLGLDSVKNAQQIQNKISYMPQRFGLYEDLSILENFELYAHLHGVTKDQQQERFEQLMRITGLSDFIQRPAGKLSGGMKQKLGVACTLVRSPELLLLDEPSVGVDPLSRLELWEIIQQLVDQEHLSVVLSTTYLDEAARCTQVCVLNQGKILAQDKPENIAQLAQGRCFDIAFKKEGNIRTLQTQLFDQTDCIVDSVPRGGKVHTIFQENIKQEVLTPILLETQSEVVSPTLEDGFMVLLSEQNQVNRRTFGYQPHSNAIQCNNKELPIIQVKNLLRTFGDFIAVNKTSFDVKRGEIFGLLGPNGAGKTTTFRMLCGLLPASEGFLEVAGVNLRTARDSARKKIGYVAQKFSLYGTLTVHENLTFFGNVYGLYGKQLNKRIDEVLEEFHLKEFLTVPCEQIPGGFKQRMSMATALLHQPEILFLDEPTSGADTMARRTFWRQIAALADQGTTIIITTHFMEEAEYCDRVMIQDAGKTLALGTPMDIRLQADPKQGQNMTMEQAFIDIITQAREEKPYAAI